MKKRALAGSLRKVSPKNFYFEDEVDITYIPSGCALLDCILGGGWALGRLANLVGDKSTGKTLIAIELTANFRKLFPDGKIFYTVGGGETFDVPYARSLGFPKDATLTTLGTIEEVYSHLEENCLGKKDKGPTVYILDSLDAISDEGERKRKIDDGSYGTKAKKVGEALRRLEDRLERHNVFFLIISQIRDNIGVMFGKKHKRSGGKALDFYAAQIVWLAEKKKINQTIKKQKRNIGIQVIAKNEKNKVGLPYRQCEFPILFNYGMDDETACAHFLKEIGVKAPANHKRTRELVHKKWREIETSFMPAKRKYQ